MYNFLKLTIMEKIFIIEQTMLWSDEETTRKRWEVLYAEKTEEKAEEDIKELQEKESLRRYEDTKNLYKIEFRISEITLY